MKISRQSSVRKATNTIQMVFMVKKLVGFGLTDHGSFTKRWNSMSSRQFQIVGKRAVSMKLLFEETPQAGFVNFLHISKRL